MKFCVLLHNNHRHENRICLYGRCAGLKDADFEFGSCSDKDPCDPNPCSEGAHCVPAREVCLSMLYKPCPQFQCGKFVFTLTCYTSLLVYVYLM